ncbi:Ig-specific serine endopeptidase MIP [Metamycoplasma canadense]|uniref:DUF31 domain-containing protein n=1 Tax=Metamycoplasma canadense TaxID=29554 RepID=A0A077L7C9_9BACT|nr:lipoprotein [Metamycoplasma canadense]BAP39711.1 hypothetical protein MCAN360_0638 [Metamycoplasma canadense]
MKEKLNFKNIKKNYALLSFLPFVLVPTIPLISCEKKEDKEEKTLKSNLDLLKKELENFKNSNETSINSKQYTDGDILAKEVEEFLKKENKNITELRKYTNKINNAITNIKNEDKRIKENIKNNENNLKPDESLKYSDEDFSKDISSLISDNLDDKLVLMFDNFLGATDKKNIFASELQENASSLKIKSKDEELNKKIIFKVESVILEDNANRTGEAKINVSFINKATLKRKNNIYSLSGLRTSPDNNDSNGKQPNNKLGPNATTSEINEYVSLNQMQRFEKDNKKYLEGLKSHLEFKAGVKKWSDLWPNVKATEKQIAEHDKKAKQLGQDSFENSAYKGFTTPSYNEDGTIDGVNLTSYELGKQPSWVDTIGKKDIYKTNGLARRIINEKYLDIAKQTFSLRLTNLNDYSDEIAKAEYAIKHWQDPNNEDEFKKLNAEKLEKIKKDREKVEEELNNKIINNKDPHLTEAFQKEKDDALEGYDKEIKRLENHNTTEEIEGLKKDIEEYRKKAAEKRESKSETGTAWILDYQLDTNGYPTKWYLGTNSHVAKAITNKLQAFTITKIDNDLKVGAKLRISEMDDNITSFNFQTPSAIRKVFDGTDYLKTSPKEFLSEKQKKEFDDLEEFVDFAVIEIDFSKIDKFTAVSNDKDVANKYPKVSDPNFSSEIAKEITNNYANNEDKHIKFIKNSYLKDFNKIEYPIKGELPKNIDHLYALGWPSSTHDYYLEDYIDNDQKNRVKFGYSHSLWTNNDSDYYKAKITQDESGPSSIPKAKLDRGNFLSYQIGYRSFAFKPGVTDTFIAAPKIGDDFYYVDGKRYVNMGLGYIPRRWAPIGGASGSSIRNQNNELVSIYYATNDNARVGLSVAFRSEGFNYEGLYGKYNLPQYDLIYGGGENQKNSYREALQKIYKEKNIKTNLFKNGLNEIPEEFKFSS